MFPIKLDQVIKRYAPGPEVVRGVSLSVPAGEFVAIVGPSGCGKTTLLNLIGGLDRPDSGHIHLDGADLATLPDSELSRLRNQSVGFVFQTYCLHPRLTAWENAMLPAMVGGLRASEARGRALDLLGEVGLADLRDALPRRLSGGQMQRVAIARALVMRPRILLADEPTGNLDETAGLEILDLILRLNRERQLTVLIVTHETRVRECAERVIPMEAGRLVGIEESIPPGPAPTNARHA